MKTKAAILYQLNTPLAVKEIEIPPLQRGQVLVKMLASGVCRSQLNEIKGLKGPDRYLPHLLGHEGAGIVCAAGTGVRKVKKGDYVVLTWIKGKGLDAPACRYRNGRETVNAGAVATFSEYTVASENRLVKIPRKVPPAVAALLGCAVPTGAGIIFNALKAKKGSSVAIFGAGGIGLSAVLAARMQGCRPVIAVDVSAEKLSLAKKLGATHFLSAGKNPVKAVRDISKGGVDYSVESSGVRSAMESAFDALNDRGVAVIVGNLRSSEKISLNPFELIKGKRIIGTWGGETDPDRDIVRYAKAYLAGRLKLSALITHRFKLKDINRALQTLDSQRAGRIIIEF